MPSIGAVTMCSIFIASTTSSGCPARHRVARRLTCTTSTVPGMGERHRPSAAPAPRAAQRGGARLAQRPTPPVAAQPQRRRRPACARRSEPSVSPSTWPPGRSAVRPGALGADRARRRRPDQRRRRPAAAAAHLDSVAVRRPCVSRNLVRPVQAGPPAASRRRHVPAGPAAHAGAPAPAPAARLVSAAAVSTSTAARGVADGRCSWRRRAPARPARCRAARPATSGSSSSARRNATLVVTPSTTVCAERPVEAGKRGGPVGAPGDDLGRASGRSRCRRRSRPRRAPSRRARRGRTARAARAPCRPVGRKPRAGSSA